MVGPKISDLADLMMRKELQRLADSRRSPLSCGSWRGNFELPVGKFAPQGTLFPCYNPGYDWPKGIIMHGNFM